MTERGVIGHPMSFCLRESKKLWAGSEYMESQTLASGSRFLDLTGKPKQENKQKPSSLKELQL